MSGTVARSLGSFADALGSSARANVSIDSGVLFVDSVNNRVGIGNSAPEHKLSVNGQGYFGTGANDFIQILSDSGAMEICRSTGDAYIDFKNLSSEDYDVRLQSIGTDGTFSIGTASGTERMRIVANGNVGIANTTSNSRLTVGGDITIYRPQSATTGTLFFGAAQTKYLFYNGANFELTGGQLLTQAINVTGGQFGYTHNGGSDEGNNTYVTRGFRGIAAGYNLDFYGVHRPGVLAYNAIQVGITNFLFYNDGNAYASASWISQSDGRVKADKTQIQDALTKNRALTGYHYRRTDLNKMNGDSVYDIGVIAQDVEAAGLTEIVHEGAAAPSIDPNGRKSLSISYNGLTALHVESIKALEDRIIQLEARLANLEK